MIKKRFISMLVLLCLTVSGAWAQNPSWVRSYDTWDEATKTLTVNTDHEQIDYAGNEAIEHVIIANTVTTIGASAFANCSNLKSVSIPSSVTNIGSSAFESTGLTSVTIPGNEENGTTIGENAFFQCGNLTTVTLGNGGGSIIGYAFDECGSLRKVIVYAQSAGTWKANIYMFGNSYNDKLKIYVASNLVDEFKNDFYWGYFSGIIVAIPTSKVSLKVGTEDASNWQGKAGEGEYQALPLEGVALGKAVSVKYSGWKLVKSVKATKEADPPGKPAAQATAEDKGKVIGTDGNIYDDDVAATDAGTTAVAKIVYIGATGHGTYTHGLALALTDEGDMEWEDAMTACNNKNTSTPVTNATWLLASKDQWDYMLGANGAGSYTALRDGYNLHRGYFWSSTESSSDRAWDYDFFHGDWSNSFKWMGSCVRACLVF